MKWTAKKISKVLDKHRSSNLSDATKKAIDKTKLKIGSKVYLKHKSAAFDRNVNSLFQAHSIGGVIQKAEDLDSAIHYYLIGLGQYEYAKVLSFNDDASGGKKPEPGVHLEFKFKDGKKLTSWYYLKDVVKMK